MAQGPGYSNRAPRVDIRRAAVLIDADGFESPVQILDVSKGGCRLKARQGLRVGAFVTLRVEHSQEFPAQIRWVAGDEVGAVFLAPVDYPILR